MDNSPTSSRRDLLIGAAALAASTLPTASLGTTMESSSGFATIHRPPDVVRAFGPDGEIALHHARDGMWEGNGVDIRTCVGPDYLSVKLRSPGKVVRIQMRWHANLASIQRYLGDHWERSYADLEWRAESASRVMPWYFMAFDGHRTHGYGVKTGAGAMCFWSADSQGITLWADVRSGGAPVELGDRTLEVARVLCREGHGNESAFQATRAFCLKMCPNPRLLDKPAYGTNDWDYAYGQSSADLIAGVSGLISELSPNASNRPYSVVDEGWAKGPYKGNFGHGPWFGNPNFGDMGKFAERLRGLGVRPGIWFRPLTPLADTPDSWKLNRDNRYLDPTIPEVIEHVASHIKRFTRWGYEMIKHDFTSWDLFGHWGFQMGPSPTRDGWKLNDASKTNAEVLTDLYRTIREAAGEAGLLGCNTVGHLAAGFHELQRSGDDTSGRNWDRTRRMGVNTLAFRSPQHRAFFDVDPDIVAITKAMPWELVEQWLRLVSESGTALFVSIEPSVVEPKHRVALKRALELAAKLQVVGEPLDWMASDCPRHWKLLGQKAEFSWMSKDGAWPFGD